MLNTPLKDYVTGRILPNVQTPAQYIGGRAEHASARTTATVKGTLCLAFPDTYALGMSHHGLQVLYSLMNAHGWACERAFTPLPDFEKALREHEVPLYSLETFTPLGQFDVLGFSLQYEIGYSNVLTMLDLGGIPLKAEDRSSRRHAGHRRRARGPEPRAARPVHRPVRHRRRRAEPAGRLRPLGRDEGGRDPEPRRQARQDRRGGRLGVRPPVLRDGLRRGRHHRRDPPDPRRRPGRDQALRDPGARRHPAADGADRPVRRDGARPDRHRDHARLPLAVPVLPEHRHQAAAPLPDGRDDRQRGPGELQEHRLRRDQPALALDQRLPQVRGAGHEDVARSSPRWA